MSALQCGLQQVWKRPAPPRYGSSCDNEATDTGPAEMNPTGAVQAQACDSTVDGTTVTMPDTPRNQDVFPQHGNQSSGRRRRA